MVSSLKAALSDLPYTIEHRIISGLSPFSVSSIDLPKTVRSKRDQILQLAAKHGARNVRVFGSVARGEADQRSDVDLLVDMDPGRSLLDLGGLLTDLRELLGCPVDVVTEKGLRRRIRERVLKEAVPI